ncbi:mammalian cell entry protein (plasmid) [Mycolicibacterium madagascariense]|uniref:Mammalian cell entry protein n=1 Tax=Mycolicibacterium madagascariense TaxID=212765 RepID=A0A7I7XPY4_9MYCO|nr:MCE family protein [Mycolicibacterium madagascariense]BBZ31255.1 mammalian cell entry protein [Mycolicibacterium madagascariense]
MIAADRPLTRRWGRTAFLAAVATIVAGCQWQGLNSLPMPGTQGGGDGSYTVQAQLPDVGVIERNSRVRVGDVNVGTITNIERQGWHALVTMRLNGDVSLPANTTAKIGQTSLLGSLHLELNPPSEAPAAGKLHEGSLIPLTNGGSYPNTDQTLAALSMLLNGGGIGQLQDINAAFATAFSGREGDLRSLVDQVNEFVGHVNDQTDDIIAATDSFNKLVDQFAAQKPVLDKALHTIPDALTVLADQRNNLSDALDSFGKFSAVTADAVSQTKQNLVSELKAAAPVLNSLANAGPALTRSLSMLTTMPFPIENIPKLIRGEYINTDVVFDLTLSRLDASFLTGTRYEGVLTKRELKWGRTIGQAPSPYTVGNPLVAPYHLDQGP